MKIRTRIYLVLAVVFAVIGFVQCVRWPRPPFGVAIGYLFHFLPSAAFGTSFALSWKKQRKLLHAILIPLCVLLVMCWSIGTFAAEMFIRATTEVTSVKQYDKVLEDYWSPLPHLVSHFPRPIPPNAENVKFSFLPKFLQGGAHIQLRYSTSPEVIGELYARFAEERTQSFFGGDANDHTNVEGGIPTTFFYTSDSGSWEFPDDFEIMVLEAKPSSSGNSWNHDKGCGVAISRKRNEIVYWAEYW